MGNDPGEHGGGGDGETWNFDGRETNENHRHVEELRGKTA
jgi:hypothetical protein